MKTQTIATKLSLDDFDRLLNYCSQSGRERSDVVRTALLMYLDKCDNQDRLNIKNETQTTSQDLNNNNDLETKIEQMLESKLSGILAKIEKIEANHNQYREKVMKPSFENITNAINQQNQKIESTYSFVQSFFSVLNDNFEQLALWNNTIENLIKRIIKLANIKIDLSDKFCYPNFHKKPTIKQLTMNKD